MYKPSLSHHVAKLIPQPSSDKTQVSYVFISTLEAPLNRKKLGDIYIVLELLAPAKKAKPICDLVVAALSREFYETAPDQDNRAGGRPNDPEQHFDSTIATINRALNAYEEKQPDETLSGLSGVIVNIADDQMMSAQAGQANVILIRHELSHNVFETGNLSKQKKHFFANIASGQIKAEDTLLLATPAFLIESDMREIRLMSSNRDLHGLIQSIQQSLADSPEARRSGLVIIRMSDYEDIAHSVLPSQKTTLLTGEADDLLKKTNRLAKQTTKNVVNYATKCSKFIGKKFKTLVIPKITQSTQQVWNMIWSKYINKNPRLAAGIVAMTIVTILIAFFAIIKPHNNLDSSVTLYKQADIHYLSAQEELTNNDRVTASKSILTANSEINKISSSDAAGVETAIKKDATVVDKVSIAQLKSRIANLSDKISSTARPTPTLIANLSAQNTDLTHLVMLDNKLYALETKDNSIAHIDPSTKKVITTPSQIPANQVVAATVDSGNAIIYYLTSAPAVWAFDSAADSAYQVQLSSGNWEKGTDISFYNGNLYLVSPTNSQILRHSPTSIGFGPGVDYIKQASINLAQITSLAINGSVYVGDQSGQISLFGVGLQSKFTTADLPVGLGWPKQLILSGDSDQMIALNNQANRIYHLQLSDSVATFTKQYAPVDISHITSIASSGQLSNVYFTAGSELYRISL